MVIEVSARRLLALREALIERDLDEAYHQLRMAVDPNCDVYSRTRSGKGIGEHWTDLESAADSEPPLAQ